MTSHLLGLANMFPLPPDLHRLFLITGNSKVIYALSHSHRLLHKITANVRYQQQLRQCARYITKEKNFYGGGDVYISRIPTGRRDGIGCCYNSNDMIRWMIWYHDDCMLYEEAWREDGSLSGQQWYETV